MLDVVGYCAMFGWPIFWKHNPSTLWIFLVVWNYMSHYRVHWGNIEEIGPSNARISLDSILLNYMVFSIWWWWVEIFEYKSCKLIFPISYDELCRTLNSFKGMLFSWQRFELSWSRSMQWHIMWILFVELDIFWV
jgi:hypothetical protein